MRILRLSAENILRLSAVEITPDGSPVVVIAGDNEAGKSSVLAAIEMAIGGKDAIPPQPIRSGQSKARVVLDLGDIIVTRTFTASGGTSLTVTNRDGAKYPSPQALLDGLVSRLTFDPLAFADADEKSQAATLRQLARINTDDLDATRADAYAERTLVNRDVTQLTGALAKLPRHPELGETLVDVGALTEQMAAVATLVQAEGAASRAVDDAMAEARRRQQACDAAERRVEELRRELEAAEGAAMTADVLLAEAMDAAQRATEVWDAAKAALPDVSGLRTQLADAEAVNAKVRENQAHSAIAAQLAEKKDEAARLTATIEDCEQQKAARLAAATFPIDGLGLSDAGVTWNGLPFSQASTAIRIRASVAIGLALNPKLRVLRVTNGNDLGARNLALLAEAAEQAGAQVWVERIAGGNGLQTIVIEDGTVKEAAHV